MSFGSSKDAKNAASGIQGAGDTLYSRTQQTPQEQQQYQGSFDLGTLLEQLFKGQAGLGSMPAGYQTGEQQIQNQGPLGQSLYSQILSQTQNPDAYFNSILQPSLMQAQDTINSYYQKRGLLNSGLAIEGMGRAGVDLAIQDAQARMQARQQGLNNALQMSQYSNGLNQNVLSNLANLYSNQQAAGQNTMNRQAQGALGAAGYQAYPYQAQLGSYYGGQAALQALPGQLIGAAGNALSGAIK